MKTKVLVVLTAIILTGISSCKTKKMEPVQEEQLSYSGIDIENRLAKYVPVKLTTDATLTDNEKEVIRLLFQAANIMNEIFWQEAYGNKEELFSKINDEGTKKFLEINYSPWDRLDGNNSFIEGIGEKPTGANYYPADMTKDEFKNWENPDKSNLYTLVRRDSSGNLYTIWYHEAFQGQIDEAAALIRQASDICDDPEFKHYLALRADALLTDQYRESDFAWLSMQNNSLDFVVGPIETYEDALFGYKASHESYILVKDKEWSEKLKKFTKLLPELQKMLPVEEAYKNEVPGVSGNQLNAYDVIFYAGDCNAGSKTIAINLPNDEVVRDSMGSRKLQLKNAMKAKFDNILVPIANELITEDQRQHVTFDAFFANTMFHEVAHGLGLGYLIHDKDITVRVALKDAYTSIEEGKADILGLFIITELYKMGKLGDVDLMDYYVTFMSSIFRSVRFGASSAHGKANMLRFNFFNDMGAFTKDESTGTYRIDFDKMKIAMEALTMKILVIQGDGDYLAAKDWIEKDAVIGEALQADLDRLEAANIPVDIIFEQGPEQLGL